MVWDSDLQSLPVVSMVFGDIRMIKRRPPHLPLLSSTPNTSEVFINEHDFRKLKKIVQRMQTNAADSFFVEQAEHW